MRKVFKRGISLFLSLLMLTSGIGVFASASTAEKPTVFIIGDSTSCRYPADNLRTGWGQVLCHFLVDTIKVDDRAVSGASSHSFYDSTWKNLKKEIKEGDYLLIQFGHNDSSEKTVTKNGVTYYDHWANPDLSSDVAPPATDSQDKNAYSYKWYLKQFIEFAHNEGAYPILVTSIDRRYRATSSNEESSELLPYVKAMKALSEELAVRENPITVPVIDVWTGFRAQIQAMESEKKDSSKAWFALTSSGSLDNTHLNETGAMEVAKIFATKLKEAAEQPAKQLAEYLLDDLQPKTINGIVKSGSSVTAISAIIGKTASARRFIAAVYDGATLKDVAIAEFSDEAGLQELQLSKSLSVASGNTVRVYYWNMANQAPFIDFFSTVIE